MADARKNFHHLLKGKQLYSTPYGVYTDVLHNFTAALKDSATKGETANTSINASPSTVEFSEHRR
jgi:hypothetical protein